MLLILDCRITKLPETTELIQLKFHIEYPLDALGHMTIMTAVPICGKTPLKSFAWNRKANDLGSWCA